jgi:orotate phosphoribosyltransferase
VNPIVSAANRVTPSPELVDALRKHALKKKSVTLSSGEKSSYYVDVKQAMLRPGPARLAGALIAAAAHDVGASVVGGMVEGAIPVACAAINSDAGHDLSAFFIRKERKTHGLQKRIEGPDECLRPGTSCLVVDDVVTTGGSTIEAIEHIKDGGLTVAGVLAVVDRLAGGAEAIEAAATAPYRALVTIDELYPDRPDRG